MGAPDVGRRSDAVSFRLWDGVVATWVVLWVVVGVWVGVELWALQGLSDGVVRSGGALGTAGRALNDLSGLPVVGERIGQLGGQVTESAAVVVTGGDEAGSSIRGLAVLLGITTGLAPLGPVLVCYLPRRLAWRREVRSVRRLLTQPDTREATLELLARRAHATLPASEVVRLGVGVPGTRRADAGPGGEGATTSVLAERELRRLGLRLTPPSPRGR